MWIESALGRLRFVLFAVPQRLEALPLLGRQLRRRGLDPFGQSHVLPELTKKHAGQLLELFRLRPGQVLLFVRIPAQIG